MFTCKRRGNNKWSKTKKTVISVVAAILALLIIAVASVLIIFDYNHKYIDENNLGVGDTKLPEGVTNIALFGVDSREGKFSGNTDSIMILSVDTVHKKIKITSVMRDSLVEISGYTPYKINSAYAKGGPELGINTLNKNFGLDIKDYATINFNGMSKMIDAVGGIDATLTDAEVKDANIHIKYMAIEQDVKPTYIKKSGKIHLNGLQAVSFARVRHVPTAEGVANDYGRTDRQRYVMNQLFNKAIKMSAIKLTKLIKTCLPYVETSLGYIDIIRLAGTLKMDGIQFAQLRIPQTDIVINGGYSVRGGSTVYFDINCAKKIVYSFIYDDLSYEEYKEKFGVTRNEWYNLEKYSKKKAIADQKDEIKQQEDVSSYYQMVEDEYNKDSSSDAGSHNNENTKEAENSEEDVTSSQEAESKSSEN